MKFNEYSRFSKLFFFTVFLISSIITYAHDNQESDYHFTQNAGQLNQKVKYHCKLHIGDIYFEKNKFTFDMYSAEDIEQLDKIRHQPDLRNAFGKKPFKIRKHAYSMEFLGSNLSTEIIATNKLSYNKNYIKGNNPSNWYSDVYSYEKITYLNTYNNINVDVYSANDYLKYDFIVKKGGNPKDIKVEYENVNAIKLKNGILEITLSTGIVKELAPIAYQNINGKKVDVACSFILEGKKLSFNLPNSYNLGYDLIIDPTWIFSTLTGSSADNWGFTATYDANGNFYGGGIAFGSGYPVSVGAYDILFGGNVDAVITKFNPTGTSIVYSTFIGGNNADQPHSLITDADSNLIILGVTSSTDFPTTALSFDQTFNGGTNFTEDGITYGNGTDIFVTKLNNTGTGLIGSTYLGGSSNDGFSLNANLKYNYADHARGEVILDANNDVYIASSTFSNNFPTTLGVYSQTPFGGYDGVVAKLSTNLGALTWSTYVGGSGGDAAYSIRVDDVNNATFVCGGTTSSNLGATTGVIGPTFSGSVDGFIAKFNNTNGSLAALTYVGTNS
ncbi:MAG: hypothetical protein GW818_08160, partial [Flavobacteriales bacterium]|nr:hypothetical protein [Flavobacteriales bacterium]